MNQKKSFQKPLFFLTFFILFCLCFCFHSNINTDQKKFDKLTKTLFQEEMLQNTLSMHYTISKPANFGITDYKIILPCYSKKESDLTVNHTKKILEELEKISLQNLAKEDREAYIILSRLLKTNLALSNYPYYDEPFSPVSGIHTSLPVLLAEYTFNTVKDVEDYLSILNQTDDYLLSLLAYEKEKCFAGFSMPDSSFEKVRAQCSTIFTKTTLDTEAHFLQTSFQEKLEELIRTNKLSLEKSKEYISENNRLLRTVILPTYEKISDELFLLEGTSAKLWGLGNYPEGKAYYEQLFISQTGSYRPLSQIKELIFAKMQEDITAIKTLINEKPGLTEFVKEKNPKSLPIIKPLDILEDLQTRIQKDFPSPPCSSPLPLHITVKNVSKNMEDYTAPAFYLTAPIDASYNNVIYINQRSTTDTINLYTTLAHEGYPGHLYQNVYCSQNLMENHLNPICSLFRWGGFLEGWAIYTEFISFDYVTDIYEELHLPFEATYAQLEKHNRSILLALYTLCDIMIHYENASLEDIASFLKPYGITNAEAVNALYTYIVENPCNYPMYYVGYLEILELQKKARKLWGENYNLLTFHQYLLEKGPADFTSLESFLTDPAYCPKPVQKQ